MPGKTSHLSIIGAALLSFDQPPYPVSTYTYSIHPFPNFVKQKMRSDSANNASVSGGVV